jgi:hypothetical protein
VKDDSANKNTDDSKRLVTWQHARSRERPKPWYVREIATRSHAFIDTLSAYYYASYEEHVLTFAGLLGRGRLKLSIREEDVSW